jgi:hypothetical protein
VKVPATSDVAPSSGKKSKTHPPKPYDIVQGMERVIDMMEETLQICKRAQRSTQDASHRRTLPLVSGHPATYTNDRRRSRSRSNLGDSNHLATSRSNLAPAATPSTYRASTTRVHGTHSVAVGYGRRSIRSATSRVPHRLPRLRTAASFRRPGSTSPPTTRDPPGGASWWSHRTTHHGSARQIPRRRVGSKPTRTTPRGGRRSSTRWYPRVPATYVSSLKRLGSRRSTAPRPTWVWRWHVSSRPTLRPRPKLPWPTSGSRLLWWRRSARRPSRLHLRLADTRAADLISLRIAGSPQSRWRSTSP